MTIGLTHVENVEDYGIADLDSDLRIRKFVEKPSRREAPSNLANSGIYFLDPAMKGWFKDERIMKMVERNKRLDFGMDLIPFLIQSGAPVYGYILRGEWYDVGSPKRYLNAMVQILRGGAKGLDIDGRLSENGNMWIQGQSPDSLEKKQVIVRDFMEGKIKLEGGVLIGRHCQIGEGTRINDSSIDNFCVIGKNVGGEYSKVGIFFVAFSDCIRVRGWDYHHPLLKISYSE